MIFIYMSGSGAEYPDRYYRVCDYALEEYVRCFGIQSPEIKKNRGYISKMPLYTAQDCARIRDAVLKVIK